MQRKIIKELTSNKELMDIYKRFKLGEVSENELNRSQAKQIDFLFDVEIEKTKREIKQLKLKIAQV